MTAADIPRSEIAVGEVNRADPRAYGRVVWRWKFLLLAFVVLIPVAVYLFESSRPKVYQSSTLMAITGGQATSAASLFDQIVQQGPDTTDLLADARLVQTSSMSREAATFLHPAPADPRSLLGSIYASADQQTGFITLTASAPSPQRAADIANAFGKAVQVNLTRSAVAQLTTAIAELQRQITQLPPRDPGRAQISQQLSRFRALRAAQSSNAAVVEPAAASSSPIAPKITRSVLLALIVGLMLGLGAVVVAEQSDRRLRHPDELGSSTGGLPLLSAIPVSAFEGPSPHAEEAFSTLRASLTYFNIDRNLTSVLITSPGKEDGKTTVAVRLAQALARDGKDVILLDADMRRPAAASLLGLAAREGLGAVLVGQLSLDQALIDVTSDDDRRGGRLRVLPAGSPPPNPSELMGSQRMRQLLAELEERSQILVIDSTPVLTVSDSIPLLRDISGVVLVARVNRTSREAIKRLREVVDSAGGNALGVVATHAPSGGLYVARGYGYEAAYAEISSREEAQARWLDKVVGKNGDGTEQATASKSD